MSGRCTSLQNPATDSTVLEYSGANFAGDGLVLKGPGNNMLHNWVWSPLSLACCTGLILDLHPAKERQHYIVTIDVSHWMGASLESGLDVAQPHNFPRQWSYTTSPPDHNIPNYCCYHHDKTIQIARFIGPTWGPPGAERTQMGPMLAPWICYLGNNCHRRSWYRWHVKLPVPGSEFCWWL